MLDLSKKLEAIRPPKSFFDKKFKHLIERYEKDPDPWGLNIKKYRTGIESFWPIYSHYFRVRVFGAENVEDKPYMVISNHTGQIAFDGVLISMAFACEIEPPRILRSMVERFLAGMPFMGQLVAEVGAILGDRDNCRYLLNKGESILVFPEGVRGVSKSTPDFYKLQKFTHGFFRLAVSSKTEILPIAVVGAEEAYPFVYQAKQMAKWFNLPAFPITPTFPFLGPIGALPLPTPIDIYIGKPFKIPDDINQDSPDNVVNEHVYYLENQIQEMIDKGLKNKRTFLKGITNKTIPRIKAIMERK